MKDLLVFGDKKFKITVPDDAKITFGPWSPPRDNNRGFDERRNMTGTLRVYQGSKENILACFAGVSGFRDLSMGYSEEVAIEEGASIWKSDDKGYVREDKVQQSREAGEDVLLRAREWVEPELPAIAAPKNGGRKKAKA